MLPMHSALQQQSDMIRQQIRPLEERLDKMATILESLVDHARLVAAHELTSLRTDVSRLLESPAHLERRAFPHARFSPPNRWLTLPLPASEGTGVHSHRSTSPALSPEAPCLSPSPSATKAPSSLPGQPLAVGSPVQSAPPLTRSPCSSVSCPPSSTHPPSTPSYTPKPPLRSPALKKRALDLPTLPAPAALAVGPFNTRPDTPPRPTPIAAGVAHPNALAAAALSPAWYQFQCRLTSSLARI
jgi:hypothetical protein